MKWILALLLLSVAVLLGQQSCEQADADGDGWTVPDGDCDDEDAEIHPGATELCDEVDNDCDALVDEELLGTAEACPALHCKEILDAELSSGDGVYWINPERDLDETSSAFEAFCDMSTDDGGWTLLITLTTSTVTFAEIADWPSTIATTGEEPDTAGMYHGSLAAFSEVREEVASAKVVAYGRDKSEEELNLIRNLYAYNTRVEVASSYSDLPACRLEYDTASDDIAGCSRYAGTSEVMNDTVIGWVVDPNDTYSSHCWFARGNCCSTSGGSSLCNGDPNGTTWARTWFR